MWWILALIIGSVVCGLFVMKPGVVFQSFEAGRVARDKLFKSILIYLKSTLIFNTYSTSIAA